MEKQMVFLETQVSYLQMKLQMFSMSLYVSIFYKVPLPRGASHMITNWYMVPL